jgi:hypothetical protein
MIKPIAAVLTLTFAPAVLAQTYIVPEGNCGAVTFHATRGSDFPNLGEAIDAALVTNAVVSLPKSKVAVKPVAGSQSLDLSANVVEGEGVVMAAVELARWSVTMKHALSMRRRSSSAAPRLRSPIGSAPRVSASKFFHRSGTVNARG